MVEAAAPHPDGLLLACRLLAQLEASGQKLTEGYYSTLIRGNANAAQLQDVLSNLQVPFAFLLWGGELHPQMWQKRGPTYGAKSGHSPNIISFRLSHSRPF